VNLQGRGHLLGMSVFGAGNRRIGRVVTAYCTPVRTNLAWIVLRLPGLWTHLRAVPTGQAQWAATGQALVVPYRSADVWASPVVDEDSLDSEASRYIVGEFYASLEQGSVHCSSADAEAAGIRPVRDSSSPRLP
jgi:hypothetical protein